MVNNNRLRALMNLPLDKFLQPVFQAYARSGIIMSLKAVEGNIVKININKQQCRG